MKYGIFIFFGTILFFNASAQNNTKYKYYTVLQSIGMNVKCSANEIERKQIDPVVVEDEKSLIDGDFQSIFSAIEQGEGSITGKVKSVEIVVEKNGRHRYLLLATICRLR